MSRARKLKLNEITPEQMKVLIEIRSEMSHFAFYFKNVCRIRKSSANIDYESLMSVYTYWLSRVILDSNYFQFDDVCMLDAKFCYILNFHLLMSGSQVNVFSIFLGKAIYTLSNIKIDYLKRLME